MPSYFPVAVKVGAPNAELSGQLGGATQGPFIYNDVLYIVIEDLDVPSSGVFTSSDGGDTWAELDSANNIPSVSTPFYDGADTIIVAWRPNGAGLQDITLRNFDLITGTWGSDYGATGPQVLGNLRVVKVYKRPDDSIVVIFPDDSPASAPTAAVYDSGSWSADISLNTNVEGLPNWDGTGDIIMNTFQSRSIMDSTGRIHYFTNTFSFITSPNVWVNRVFYQAFETDNSLGSFLDFPGQDPLVSSHQDLEVFSGPPFGQPAILGDDLLLPVSLYNRLTASPDQYPALYIGAGLSGPSWSIDSALSLDPEIFTDDTIIWMEAPSFWTDGAKLVAIGPAQGADPFFSAFSRLRLSQSTNIAAPDEDWEAETIWDTDIDPTFGELMVIASVRITQGQIQVTTDFIDPSFDEARYWMGNWTPGMLLRNTFE